MQPFQFIASSSHQRLPDQTTEDTRSKLEDLLTLAEIYLAEADRCVYHCSVFTGVRDKPNCHWILELCVNGILFSDMVSLSVSLF